MLHTVPVCQPPVWVCQTLPALAEVPRAWVLGAQLEDLGNCKKRGGQGHARTHMCKKMGRQGSQEVMPEVVGVNWVGVEWVPVLFMFACFRVFSGCRFFGCVFQPAVAGFSDCSNRKKHLWEGNAIFRHCRGDSSDFPPFSTNFSSPAGLFRQSRISSFSKCVCPDPQRR